MQRWYKGKIAGTTKATALFEFFEEQFSKTEGRTRDTQDGINILIHEGLTQEQSDALDRAITSYAVAEALKDTKGRETIAEEANARFREEKALGPENKFLQMIDIIDGKLQIKDTFKRNDIDSRVLQDVKKGFSDLSGNFKDLMTVYN